MRSPITFCITTFNNLNYLKLAIYSIRKYSYFNESPIIIYSENSTDGTNEWLLTEGKEKFQVETYIEYNIISKGIGGGMNFCAKKVKTPYIMFLHADFFVSKNWDIEALKISEQHSCPSWISSYRIQPNIFREDSRPGTLIVPLDEFGEYYHNFNEEYFIAYSEEFSLLNNIEIRKGEGVSGLIKKIDWDFIGGNDDLFAPAYFEDFDLFMRMQMENYKFILTSKSIVYHFASRASRFPDDNLNERKPELANHERNGFQKWIKKWGRPPSQDVQGFIIPITGTTNPNRI
jgi:GT2 family glycosyltransferase